VLRSYARVRARVMARALFHRPEAMLRKWDQTTPNQPRTRRRGNNGLTVQPKSVAEHAFVLAHSPSQFLCVFRYLVGFILSCLMFN
jgi:hypothetical protein